jgi:hypothetical protein
MAVFWRSGNATVWVEYRGDTLTFYGLDRGYRDGGDYEYVISVPSAGFDAVRRALGGGPDADVVELVCGQVDQIMPRGERTWLDEHGIAYEVTGY